MKLKEAEYQRCSKCGRTEKCISEEVYGCDNCKREYDQDKLDLTVFYKNIDDVKHYQFCCWECVLKFLPKIKSDGVDFVNLPYLLYNNKVPEGCAASDLIELISRT